MGPLAKPRFFDRCPWAVVAGDPDIGKQLTAYGLLERWPSTVPASTTRDPRTLAALSVIANTHAAIDREEAEKHG